MSLRSKNKAERIRFTLMKNKNPKAALLTVFLVVLVDLAGFGIVLPLMPFYAVQYNVSPLMIGVLYSIYSCAQLIFSPIWGSLSDRIGRRPVMLISTAGAALSYLLFAFSNSFLLLLSSRLFAGIMGGNISAAQAYIADVTEHKDRAKGMGLIGAAFGIGFVLGPAFSALVLHFGEAWGLKNPYIYPGILAAALSMLSFILVLTKLPETVVRGELPVVSEQKLSVLSISFWKAFAQEHSALFRWMLLSALLIAIGHSSLYSAFPLFCRNQLSMDARQVGIQFVIMGVVAVIIQGGLMRVLVKRFSEKSLFITGSFFMALGMILIPFAKTTQMLGLYLGVMAMGGSLNGPTLTSLISKKADPSRMGQAMGISQGMSAMGRVIGPTWGGWLFLMSPQYPFWITAAIVSITFFIGWSFKD